MTDINLPKCKNILPKLIANDFNCMIHTKYCYVYDKNLSIKITKDGSKIIKKIFAMFETNKY